MRLFELSAPDGRTIRHRSEEFPILEKGYEVTGEVFGARDDNTGGFVNHVDGESLMSALLDAYGDELQAWLSARGYQRAPPEPAESFSVETERLRSETYKRNRR